MVGSKFIGENKCSLRFWVQVVNISFFFKRTVSYFLTPRGHTNTKLPGILNIPYRIPFYYFTLWRLQPIWIGEQLGKFHFCIILRGESILAISLPMNDQNPRRFSIAKFQANRADFQITTNVLFVWQEPKFKLLYLIWLKEERRCCLGVAFIHDTVLIVIWQVKANIQLTEVNVFGAVGSHEHWNLAFLIGVEHGWLKLDFTLNKGYHTTNVRGDYFVFCDGNQRCVMPFK